jgi:hypothetical protein
MTLVLNGGAFVSSRNGNTTSSFRSNIIRTYNDKYKLFCLKHFFPEYSFTPNNSTLYSLCSVQRVPSSTLNCKIIRVPPSVIFFVTQPISRKYCEYEYASLYKLLVCAKILVRNESFPFANSNLC